MASQLNATIIQQNKKVITNVLWSEKASIVIAHCWECVPRASVSRWMTVPAVDVLLWFIDCLLCAQQFAVITNYIQRCGLKSAT